MIAAGMDIGGTKIEAQIFDADWQQVARHRAETPDGYPEFLGAIADMAKWVEAQAGRIPIGLGSAGLVSPETGMALTANLPATGHRLVEDVAAKVERKLPFINDCRALTPVRGGVWRGQGCGPGRRADSGHWGRRRSGGERPAFAGTPRSGRRIWPCCRARPYCRARNAACGDLRLRASGLCRNPDLGSRPGANCQGQNWSGTDPRRTSLRGAPARPILRRSGRSGARWSPIC